MAECYLGGAELPPESVGGHGLPLGDIPGVDEPLWPFPALEDPSGVGLFGFLDVFGSVPHGELGTEPGFVFGLIVEGLVGLPGVAGFGEFDPGTVVGTVGVAAPDCGVEGEVGVAGLRGGVTGLEGGVAVAGVCACPGMAVPLDGGAVGVL